MGSSTEPFPQTVFLSQKDDARGMKVLNRSVYKGPHLYSHTPMIRFELALGELENYPTNKISGFNERLLAALPGLSQHGCSYGQPGGFVKRLEDGTWLGHVTEHVALEIQTRAGNSVTRGKTRSVKGKSGTYNVMYEYRNAKVGLLAGRYALELVNSFLPEELQGIQDIDVLTGKNETEIITAQEAIEKLKLILKREKLGPTTQSIVDAAKKRNIPVIPLDGSFIQLGWGKNQRRIRCSVSDGTSQIAVEAAGDKELTKNLLKAAGVPVPPGELVRTLEGAFEVARELGYPVTIKPLDGNHGRGVTTDIREDAQIQSAFEKAKLHSKYVIVEKYLSGRDYRVLVVDGKVVAAAERVPAHIIGDGINTVKQLVDIVNSDPRRGEGHEEVLTKISIDSHVEVLLAQQQMTKNCVPQSGQHVRLRGTANMSTGGTARDCTDLVHPLNLVLMERAAKAIGLDIAGIDLITTDISKPMDVNGCGVIEVNAAPGFRMHLEPTEGRPRPVGEAVISMLFPKQKQARIPIIAVTGTNGKSTTVRMLVNILRQGGKRVGFTSTSGVYINDEVIWEGDASGPKSAQMLLKDSTIDYAVLETARGGIVREGLAFDYCDAGAVLNVTEDHIGIGGIQTIQDLAAVKSVVAESVSSKGVSVLNADDPLTRNMARDAGGRTCFFSMHGGVKMSDFLRDHISNGGMALVREEWDGFEQIVIHDNNQRTLLMRVDEIPATFKGKTAFNVQNALAAAALACGMNIAPELIRSGLSGFYSSYEMNPGRFNIYDEHGFRVIMDYAHNPAGLTAFLGAVDNMAPNYNNIIGTVCTPGDRRDEDILAMGRIAARSLDIIVCRESPDERGRIPGEVNRLLREGALSVGFPEENIICIRPEEEATDACLNKAQAGDLVIITPTDVKGIWDRILNFKKQNDFFEQHEKTGMASFNA